MFINSYGAGVHRVVGRYGGVCLRGDATLAAHKESEIVPLIVTSSHP